MTFYVDGILKDFLRFRSIFQKVIYIILGTTYLFVNFVEILRIAEK